MSIREVRFELGDTSDLPIMSDQEIRYFLDKNEWSVRRASLDTAKSMLFKLSMRTDEQVDIFSISGSKAAKAFMDALRMYIKDQALNPLNNIIKGYASGISKQDIQENNDNPDNNRAVPPNEDRRIIFLTQTDPFNYKPFMTTW